MKKVRMGQREETGSRAQSERIRHTWPMRAANVFETGKRLVGRGARLDVETVTNFALGATQRTDLGDPYYLDGLEKLLEAGREAPLTAAGRRALRDAAWSHLARRILITDVKRTRPELFTGTLEPSFLVLGWPRSGTTHLHRLLAMDPQFYGVPYWELLAPVPPHFIDPGAVDSRRERCIAGVEAMSKYGEQTADVHYFDADTAEECSFLQMCDFHSGLFWAIFPVGGYAAWLASDDASKNAPKVYDDYRKYLHLLQSQHPGQGLALKAPEHAAWADLILEKIPEAMVIQTHRDPVAVLSSLNSLVYRNHKTVSRHLDKRAIAAQNIELLRTALDRNLRARERHPDEILDVAYSDIVERPIEVVHQIYDRFGVTWPTGHDAALQSYLDANPQGRHGRHNHSLDDFGLSAADVRRQFADYKDVFDLS